MMVHAWVAVLGFLIGLVGGVGVIALFKSGDVDPVPDDNSYDFVHRRP